VMPKSKKRGGKKKTSAKQKEVPGNVVVYNGPVVPYYDSMSLDLHTQVLTYDATALSSGAGLMDPTFQFSNPNPAADWSNFIAIYDEYRVLAMDVVFCPNMEDTLNTAGLAQLFAPMLSVIDRDTNAALTTYAAALNYGSINYHTLTKKARREMKMSGVNSEISGGIPSGEGVFLNCQSAPTLSGSIKFVAVGLTANSTYGHFYVRWLVQFRGRGV